MIEGEAIRLRAWREDDLQMLGALRNDVAVQAQLLARARGSNAEQVRSWLEDRANRFLFVIADISTDNALGFLQITDLDPIDHRGDLGICLSSEVRGRGLGGEAITLASKHLSDIWGLRKLTLWVRADNSTAINCYEKTGFERCGLLRKHVYIDGHWQDVVIMECFISGEA